MQPIVRQDVIHKIQGIQSRHAQGEVPVRKAQVGRNRQRLCPRPRTQSLLATECNFLAAVTGIHRRKSHVRRAGCQSLLVESLHPCPRAPHLRTPAPPRGALQYRQRVPKIRAVHIIRINARNVFTACVQQALVERYDVPLIVRVSNVRSSGGQQMLAQLYLGTVGGGVVDHNHLIVTGRGLRKNRCANNRPKNRRRCRSERQN